MASKNNDNKALKRFCKICKREISPKFNCACSGGGGAGGGSNDEKNESSSELLSSGSEAGLSPKHLIVDNSGQPSLRYENPKLTPKRSFLEIINDLIENKLLTIDNNIGLCTVTIQYDPKHLSELQLIAVNLFIKEIKNELEKCKEINHLRDSECFVKEQTDGKGNITQISINIPNPKLYNRFFNQLKDHNLIPGSVLSMDRTSQENSDNTFNPTPLETKPRPKGFKE